jgi:hypothetical protein
VGHWITDNLARAAFLNRLHRDATDVFRALRDLLYFHHGNCHECSADGPGPRCQGWYDLVKKIDPENVSDWKEQSEP